MNQSIITDVQIQSFHAHLLQEEKSAVTVEKYLRDVRLFRAFAGERPVTKELVLEYKQQLIVKGYAPRSVNSMLAAVNSLFAFLGWQGCRVRSLRIQRQVYCPEEKELTLEEYRRLLAAAGGNTRLQLILQTICSTGIRVSELRYFTVEAVRGGQITVSCKNKTRVVFVPGKLRQKLMEYARRCGRKSGGIFVTNAGKPLHRSSIWAAMKRLCRKAGVLMGKVFPHNLRKLFARCFYRQEKDIAKLADVLGHSSINTTRIYIIDTGREHRKLIDRLQLLL